MKSVGVIGGLGPETTAEFYLSVIFGCQKLNNIQRPSIVIGSVPLTFEIESDLIEKNHGKERYIPFLIAEARRLEKAGVDFIVMPCNSLHVFIEEIRKAVSIPVISIVEEVTNYLLAKEFKNAGLISTSATVANSVYETKFAEAGISVTTPDGLQKATMDKIIKRLVAGQHLNSDRETVHKIVGDLAEKNVDCVALACTDLQLLIPISNKVEVFDTMKILVDSTIKAILSNK